MMIVFDLDGTLADASHRLHFIDPNGVVGGKRDWDGFFAACGNDAPMPAILVLCAMVANGHHVEIWTGRSEGPGGSNRTITRDWLLEHTDMAVDPRGIRRLRMRAHGDHRHDDKLKAEWLQEVRDEGREVTLVFEDRQRVVDMWRRWGVPCFQVAPGDF